MGKPINIGKMIGPMIEEHLRQLHPIDRTWIEDRKQYRLFVQYVLREAKNDN